MKENNAHWIVYPAILIFAAVVIMSLLPDWFLAGIFS